MSWWGADCRLGTSPFLRMVLRVISLRDSLCPWWEYLAVAKYLVCWLRWIPRGCSSAKIDLFSERREKLIVCERESIKQFLLTIIRQYQRGEQSGMHLNPPLEMFGEWCCPWRLLENEKMTSRFASLSPCLFPFAAIFSSLSPLCYIDSRRTCSRVLVYPCDET